MSTIVTRAGKGSTLSWNEVDANFINLNTDKVDSTDIGVSIQPYSANLTEYAAVNPTTAGLALLDDVDAAAQRTTLGLGNVDNTSDATKDSAVSTLTNKTITAPKIKAGQFGDSGTATNNFTITAEAADGTMKLARGNAGATTQDILTVDALGKVAFPQNAAPAFAAETVGGQTLPSGVAAKYNNASELFDTDNAYDAPNSRFTPQVAGYYQVNLCVSIMAGTALSSLGAQVRKNGVVTAELSSFITMPTAAIYGIVPVSGLIYMNGTTDYIESWVIATGTGAMTASARANAFSASLVRAA